MSFSFFKDHQRSHYCGELREDHLDKEVVLCGWVENRRDHGGCIFIDLRDRSGISQIVFDPGYEKESFDLAKALRSEFSIGIVGKVISRGDNVNPRLETGAVEIKCHKLEVFSKAKTTPFTIEDRTDASEALRLQYRYLDLRRPMMQKIFKVRNQVLSLTRTYFAENNFWELETPYLIKGTPEGARDFLVPSRMNHGKGYALPQSPQIFKQLFMVAGYDRYYQIVRCFRDEDYRANRQPEFTQVDVEMSYQPMEEILRICSGLYRYVFGKLGIEFPEKIPSLSFSEAMERFGTDKPDLRFGMELKNITPICKEIDFKVFKSVAESGGLVKVLNFESGAEFSRKELDDLTGFAQKFGAKGLAWVKLKEEGWQSPIAKFFSDEAKAKVVEVCGAKTGDLLLFCADKPKVVNDVLGNLRNHLAKQKGLIPKGVLKPLWVVDFPLFELDGEGNITSSHHPFTAPRSEDLEKLAENPLSVKAEAYDLVLNGEEMAGGSIRIHDQETQKLIFKHLQFSEEEMTQKFGFLIEALSYGTPPHGGIAFGLDRLIMEITQSESIRDVIPFPKTQKGSCLMTEAPSQLEAQALKDLGLKIDLS